MKFKVDTAKCFYVNKRDIDNLKKIGFEFEEYIDNKRGSLFTIKDSVGLTIQSLEDLMAIVSKFGKIILTENRITIYDDYIE